MRSVPTQDTSPGTWRVALAPATLCALVSLRALLRADLDVYDTRDEQLFHHPTIQAFAAALPTPDLSDYPSATGPLYHLLLAPLARVSGDDLLLLRLATLGLALVGLLAGSALLARRTTQPAWGLALLLTPLALSPYFVGPAVRLSTDDAALAFVLLALLALDRARDRDLAPGPLALAALAAAAAVLTRQVHGWLVGVVGLLALWPGPVSLGRRVATAGLALLPVAALAPLALLWGGLTPPSFAEHQAGLNPAVLQTELAVLGALALPMAPWLHRILGTRGLLAALLGGAAAAAALLLAAPLPWVEDPLRYGGSLWRVCQAFPDVAGTTAPFWLLVPLGLTAVAAFVVDARRRGDPLAAATLLAFLVANMASARAYQKYYEPLLVVLLGWLLARQAPAPRWWWVGPALLALAWLAVAVSRFVL